MLGGVALLLAVAVLATLATVLGRGTDRITAELPPAPPVPTHPVVDELTRAGLECVDEAHDPWLVKGCHHLVDSRRVSVRMKVTPDGVIDKFSVQVLDDRVTADERREEFLELTRLMIQAAGVGAADRQVVEKGVAAGADLGLVEVEWGELYLPAPVTDTLNVTLTRADVDPSSLPPRNVLSASYDTLRVALEERGYHCVDGASATFSCFDDRRTEVRGASNEEGISLLSIAFTGPVPTAESPLMTDVDDVLAELDDPRAAALRAGLIRMATYQPEQVFVDGTRISRWTQHFAVESVGFP